MPMMKYLCRVCGLQFEKLVVDPVPQDIPCKGRGCEAKARVRLSAGASLTTSSVVTGPEPQNTGMSHLDHDVDRVIARDADVKIQEMMGRQHEKRALMEREGVDGHHLSRLSDGDYFVMTEDQRKAAKRARILYMRAQDSRPPDLKIPWPKAQSKRSP